MPAEIVERFLPQSEYAQAAFSQRYLLILPLAIFTLAFLILPLVRLTVEAGSGPQGIAGFFVILTEARFRNSLIVTLILSILTTVATLTVATIAAQTLAHRQFFGRGLLLSRPRATRRRSRRFRGRLPGGLIFELDVFSGPLAPLMLVEVEFPSVEMAEAFVPPAWFGAEVTEDERYRNRALVAEQASG